LPVVGPTVSAAIRATWLLEAGGWDELRKTALQLELLRGIG